MVFGRRVCLSTAASGRRANLEVGQQLSEVNIRAFSGTSIIAKQLTYCWLWKKVIKQPESYL